MMNLINLIWMLHPQGINSLLTARDNGENYNYELSALMAGLYADNELSEYTDGELQSAVSEIMTDYLNF